MQRFIDLRSDTVTRPTPAMADAMMAAPVGDDVFGEDPTVNALEARMAAMFGHQAAMFCPSGTMTNQIAIRVHTRPGDEVISDEDAHIYRYEGGGTMANSGCSVRLLSSDRGRFTAEDVEAAINDPGATWLARTRLVSVENSHNRAGGAVWDIGELRRISGLCRSKDLAFHMDGARIFNALAVSGQRSEDVGPLFDSISVCLSKGLGCPVGSVLIGSASFVHEARRVRKRMGGGMRQAGFLAAAGLHALDHHLQRLVEDHRRAGVLGEVLSCSPLVQHLAPVETNIVVFDLKAGLSAKDFLEDLRQQGILAIQFGPARIRMVTHLDLTEADLAHVVGTLRSMATRNIPT